MEKMKNYKFKIGTKELELFAPSIESAYYNAECYKIQFGWKGILKLIEIS
jgi:hypothetical protein